MILISNMTYGFKHDRAQPMLIVRGRFPIHQKIVLWINIQNRIYYRLNNLWPALHTKDISQHYMCSIPKALNYWWRIYDDNDKLLCNFQSRNILASSTIHMRFLWKFITHLNVVKIVSYWCRCSKRFRSSNPSWFSL